MTSSAELGPIDTQLPHPNAPEETISALEGFKGLEAVSSFCQRFLDEAMLLVLRQTGRGIKDSLELATNFAAPVVRPLFDQIDPMDLGRYKRALEIGVEYAQRLLRAEGYAHHDLQKIVDRLVYGYPEHGFVIDLAEARALGIRVEVADAVTESLATSIIDALPGESYLGFLDGGSAVGTMLPKAPDKKDGADGQRANESSGSRA